MSRIMREMSRIMRALTTLRVMSRSFRLESLIENTHIIDQTHEVSMIIDETHEVYYEKVDKMSLALPHWHCHTGIAISTRRDLESNPYTAR